jgi:hypothetical protein
MASDDAPTRGELLNAKADLQRQLEIVRDPAMARDRNPGLVAKLATMIAQIDECLSATEEGLG